MLETVFSEDFRGEQFPQFLQFLLEQFMYLETLFSYTLEGQHGCYYYCMGLAGTYIYVHIRARLSGDETATVINGAAH